MANDQVLYVVKSNAQDWSFCVENHIGGVLFRPETGGTWSQKHYKPGWVVDQLGAKLFMVDSIPADKVAVLMWNMSIATCQPQTPEPTETSEDRVVSLLGQLESAGLIGDSIYEQLACDRVLSEVISKEKYGEHVPAADALPVFMSNGPFLTPLLGGPDLVDPAPSSFKDKDAVPLTHDLLGTSLTTIDLLDDSFYEALAHDFMLPDDFVTGICNSPFPQNPAPDGFMLPDELLTGINNSLASDNPALDGLASGDTARSPPRKRPSLTICDTALETSTNNGVFRKQAQLNWIAHGTPAPSSSTGSDIPAMPAHEDRPAPSSPIWVSSGSSEASLLQLEDRPAQRSRQGSGPGSGGYKAPPGITAPRSIGESRDKTRMRVTDSHQLSPGIFDILEGIDPLLSDPATRPASLPVQLAPKPPTGGLHWMNVTVDSIDYCPNGKLQQWVNYTFG
ncbi:uncharacterized protein BO97DRAFT_409897 [Aspergillus homomorphus CBS 101889]|uniref:Uncharacterized protein n=1 Tax=Aspergillus homomorphus (strain CBS 101889) TaxID=1450537 RepID=A0A395ICE1_ASPHC|nr:hypothetical protein BO97DRAFT_409897 [Aspergillus homomorphus CBS 101889]RAL17469.1 hypothetical protein BO97DRAFT_409897 [Aspergillus homomorphus CBS 101889]